jgi:hypothetical protein
MTATIRTRGAATPVAWARSQGGRWGLAVVAAEVVGI